MSRSVGTPHGVARFLDGWKNLVLTRLLLRLHTAACALARLSSFYLVLLSLTSLLV